MRIFFPVSLVPSFLLLFCAVGCETITTSHEILEQDNQEKKGTYSSYEPYLAQKIVIMPLTKIEKQNSTDNQSKIKVYISLLDSFGYQIKSPGIFRFELYEYVERSAEPKGQRITIWPDINLVDPADNNTYWQDFLRAYKFELDFNQNEYQSCILQVTCLCPDGKRLSEKLKLKM